MDESPRADEPAPDEGGDASPAPEAPPAPATPPEAQGPPQVPNLLVAYTILAPLDRVPAYADRLWKRIHAVEGRCVRMSGMFLRGFGEAFERIGLAEVARSEIERNKAGDTAPRAIYLRFHTIALFEHLAKVLAAMSAFVREFWECDPVLTSDPLFGGGGGPPLGPPQPPSLANRAWLDQLANVDGALGARLERRRNGLLRIEGLAKDAGRAGALRFAPEEVAKQHPVPVDPAEAVEIDEMGLKASDAPRREWLPIPDLAAAVVADAALLVEDVATCALTRLEQAERARRRRARKAAPSGPYEMDAAWGAARLELDVRLELGTA